MNEKLKEKLAILRQRIPIGLRHGLTLLETVEGNLEKAEKQFVEEMVALTISKTGVESDVAIRHLTKNNFDIGLTIKSIEEERYTFTKLILRKGKGKEEDALGKIVLAIEEKYKLKRDFWLIFDHLRDLPSEIYCLITTIEWLNYESWEDYGTALTFNLAIVTEQLESKLGLGDLANSLRQANAIQTLVFAQNKTHIDIQNYIKATNELQKNKEYARCAEYFITQRPIVIERLYELVKNNIDKFP